MLTATSLILYPNICIVMLLKMGFLPKLTLKVSLKAGHFGRVPRVLLNASITYYCNIFLICHMLNMYSFFIEIKVAWLQQMKLHQSKRGEKELGYIRLSYIHTAPEEDAGLI